jgi:hypothetical protein
MDLRYDVDGYSTASAESLQSYFKPGEDSTLLGRNFIDMNRPDGSRVLTLVTGTLAPEGDAPISPFVAPATGADRSVSLDGVSEYFSTGDPQLDSLGFDNAFSISLWANRQQLLVDRQILKIGSVNDLFPNTILIEATGSAGVTVSFRDAAGVLFVEFIWNSVFTSLDSWKHLVLTWDGFFTALWINGVETFPDIWSVNGFGTMGDGGRAIFYGAFKTGNEKPFPGYLGHLGMWNIVLPEADIDEIFDNGHSIDLTADFGNYVNSAGLKHYWRPGFVDVGFTDEKATPTSIDFDDSVNLDGTDIVDDAP